MDDYIQVLLEFQGIGEEENENAPELTEDVFAISALGVQEKPASRPEQGQGVRREEEVRKETAEETSGLLWKLLQQMRPVTVHGENQVENLAQEKDSPPNQAVRFSCGSVPNERRELTPENLSMFFQRDARRYS